MKIKVCSLGLRGSYSHIACLNYFKKGFSYHVCKSSAEIFALVQKGKCSFGLAALENSTAGSISETYDCLRKYKLFIVGEIILNINHYLLANNNLIFEKNYANIENCYAHSQTFYQCQNFLDNFPWIKRVEVADNATAAMFISKREKPDLAVSSKLASRLYKLKIVTDKITDAVDNYTRFIIVSKKMKKTGNKMSLSFHLKHVPGSLAKALKPYEKYKLNLTKIESRPIIGTKWEYQFYLDYEFSNLNIALKVVNLMKKVTEKLQILGIYHPGKSYAT